MTAVRVALFSSGTGTNFEAIADAAREGDLGAEIVALVCDRPDAAVIGKAHARGIKTILVPVKTGQSRASHEEEILEQLLPLQPKFGVLAGYMRVLTPTFLQAFDSKRGYFRVTNIHPSLLPAFPGVNAYTQAFNSGVKISGCTVHWVDQGVDSGPVCAQEAFTISDCKSVTEVRARGLAVEHRLYPESLKWMIQEKFLLEKREGRLCVLPN